MASNTPKKNRPDQTAAEQKLVDGLDKHAPTIPWFMIGGATVTTKAIINNLQTLIDSANAVQSTRATWQNTVRSDKDARIKLRTFVSGLRQALLVAFAGSVDALADFGLTARKVPVRTPEEKTAAALKAKATRAARHTLGKVQKKAIKGTVSATAPAHTPAASPAPATTPAPAPMNAPAITATPGAAH